MQVKFLCLFVGMLFLPTSMHAAKVRQIKNKDNTKCVLREDTACKQNFEHPADFSRANLSRSNFSGSTFTGTAADILNMRGADLLSANFHDTSFNFVSLGGSNIERANFSKTTITNSYFDDIEGHHVDFSDATITDSEFDAAQIRVSNFERTKIKGVNFNASANLNNANFQHAEIGPSLVKVDPKSSSSQKASSSFKEARLTAADFRFSTLTGVNFKDATLEEADFSCTIFARSGDGRDVNMKGTNLARAKFFYADLRGLDLTASEIELAGANYCSTIDTDGQLRSQRNCHVTKEDSCCGHKDSCTKFAAFCKADPADAAKCVARTEGEIRDYVKANP